MSAVDRWMSRTVRRFSRRQLFGAVGALGAGGWLGRRGEGTVAASQTATATEVTPASVYRALGVRPFVNGRGTYTVLGGNIELPEVRAAKSAANQQHAQLDELAAAAGRRLAELTGAEWGMVSAGCAAAMSHATAACVAGGNPDLHVRIPNLEGFAKDEVIIPGHSRNVYDAAIRAVGVRIVEAETPEELELAIGPRTAMIYIFAGPRNESGPMGTEAIAAIARRHNVPVLVDAAAEILTVPNVHLERGATLVAYSGGKFLRGPQSAGVLLGRKDLVQAAWVHSAPHHGYARSMKVGREEIVGMVVAIESWVARDHQAEWRTWTARLDYIATRLANLPGVTSQLQTDLGGRSNRSPSLTVRWQSADRGMTGQDVVRILDSTDPRVLINPAGGGGQAGGGDTGVVMVPSTMSPGDERIVAERLLAVLATAQPRRAAATAAPPAGDISGQWAIDIQFAASRSTHTVALVQVDHRLTGSHKGNYVTRDVQGTLNGDQVTLTSNVTERTGDALTYRFTGTLVGDTMSGTLDMGEYLQATWTAARRGPARQA